MGFYLNPRNQDKEEWLEGNGREIGQHDSIGPEVFDFNGTELPVCLVDNGAFTAAGIAFDKHEYNAFARDDGRYKRWFLVRRELLNEIVPGLKELK